MLDRLDEWRDRLTSEMLRAVGGDRFAPELSPVENDVSDVMLRRLA
jgi:hypothetical protein